jgi:hypothetical protein
MMHMDMSAEKNLVAHAYSNYHHNDKLFSFVQCLIITICL